MGLERHVLRNGKGIGNTKQKTLLAKDTKHGRRIVKAIFNRRVVDDARLIATHVVTHQAGATKARHVHAADARSKLSVAHGNHHAALSATGVGGINPRLKHLLDILARHLFVHVLPDRTPRFD